MWAYYTNVEIIGNNKTAIIYNKSCTLSCLRGGEKYGVC